MVGSFQVAKCLSWWPDGGAGGAVWPRFPIHRLIGRGVCLVIDRVHPAREKLIFGGKCGRVSGSRVHQLHDSRSEVLQRWPPIAGLSSKQSSAFKAQTRLRCTADGVESPPVTGKRLFATMVCLPQGPQAPSSRVRCIPHGGPSVPACSANIQTWAQRIVAFIHHPPLALQ